MQPNSEIINILHIIFIFIIFMSPFIDDCFIKQLILLLLIFITIHYLTKYGKCGLINIEMFFLKDTFRNGILFKTIKPIISYKNNIFYDNYGTFILFIYMIILIQQIYNNKLMCEKEFINIYNQFYNLYKSISLPKI